MATDADLEVYTAEMDRAKLLLPIVMAIPVAVLQNTITHLHTVGPILDPTRYRDSMSNLEDAQFVAEAIAAFQKKVRQSSRLMHALAQQGIT